VTPSEAATMSAQGHVKDPKLADEGVNRIEWAEREMPVLRQIKGDPALKMIPVVVMTSSREEQDLLNSYQLGVNAYVVKPVKFQSFVDAVGQVGAFWAVLNEAPPGSLRRDNS